MADTTAPNTAERKVRKKLRTAYVLLLLSAILNAFLLARSQTQSRRLWQARLREATLSRKIGEASLVLRDLVRFAYDHPEVERLLTKYQIQQIDPELRVRPQPVRPAAGSGVR